MFRLSLHITLGLAIFLLIGCKASHDVLDNHVGSHRDSVFIHTVDSYRTRSIFDSLSLSLIHHDTVIRIERIFRDISQAATQIHDTVQLHQRDTVTVYQDNDSPSHARDWILTLFTWILGVLILMFVSHVWRR